jgi:hypothetical protein
MFVRHDDRNVFVAVSVQTVEETSACPDPAWNIAFDTYRAMRELLRRGKSH